MTIFVKIFKKIFNAPVVNKNITRVILFAFLFNIIFGILFYYAEKDVQTDMTMLDAIWWAMVTMTTVGYGDFFAKTFIGRFLISYPCMLLGIGIIGYLVGNVAESILDHASKKKKGLLGITMNDHIIICNFPGESKILRLQEEIQRANVYKDSTIVIITDEIDELPQSLVENKIRFVKGDPVREEVLMKANILECAGVFILAENIEDASSDTKTFAIGTQIEMIERESGHPIKVVVELVSRDNHKMMLRSKVDSIVTSDGIMDVLIAQEFLYPGLNDVFHEILSNASGSQFYILENKFAGFTFSDIQKKALDHKTNIQVVGFNRKGNSFVNPDKNTKLETDDKLIVLANSRADYENFETSMGNP